MGQGLKLWRSTVPSASPLIGTLLALAVLAVACAPANDNDAARIPTTAIGQAQQTDTDGSIDSVDDTAGNEGQTTVTVYDAASDPVRIGVLTSLTGQLAASGQQLRDGMQLAADDLADSGGVNGRPIELIVVDDGGSAEQAVKGVEQLIDEGVLAIAGTLSSDVALAIGPVVEQVGTPLFLTKAGSEADLVEASRFTFRTCVPAAPMMTAPIVEHAEAQGFTNIGAITADDAWGQTIKASLEADIAAASGIRLRAVEVEAGKADLTEALTSLQEFETDLLILTGHPTAASLVLSESSALGFDVPVIGGYLPLSTVAGSAGALAIDRYGDVGCADYAAPSYQEMAGRFVAATENTFMEDDAVAGYGTVTMMADAVRNVGNERDDIAAYLHGATYDLPGYAFPVNWTKWGELATAQPPLVLVGSGPAPDGVNSDGEWYPEVLLKPSPLTPSPPAS